jgi:hypothetical protein
VDVNGFKNFYPLKVTGDGTGTINISGNGQMQYPTTSSNSWENVNIYSEVVGTVMVSYLDGIVNLTVASGTFRVEFV